jgi:hypothetical protein
VPQHLYKVSQLYAGCVRYDEGEDVLCFDKRPAQETRLTGSVDITREMGNVSHFRFPIYLIKTISFIASCNYERNVASLWLIYVSAHYCNPASIAVMEGERRDTRFVLRAYLPIFSHFPPARNGNTRLKKR